MSSKVASDLVTGLVPMLPHRCWKKYTPVLCPGLYLQGDIFWMTTQISWIDIQLNETHYRLGGDGTEA